MTEPRFKTLRATGAGIATATPSGYEFKPYRWHDNPDPGRDIPPRTREQARRSSPRNGVTPANAVEAAARREKFGLLRADGQSVTEAGAAVGVGPDTAKKYERARLRELRGES